MRTKVCRDAIAFRDDARIGGAVTWRSGAQLEHEYQQGNPAVTSMLETLDDVPARTAQMRASRGFMLDGCEDAGAERLPLTVLERQKCL